MPNSSKRITDLSPTPASSTAKLITTLGAYMADIRILELVEMVVLRRVRGLAQGDQQEQSFAEGRMLGTFRLFTRPKKSSFAIE